MLQHKTCNGPKMSKLHFSRYVESNFGQRIEHLPTRYLPPGTIRMLWYGFKTIHPDISFLSYNKFSPTTHCVNVFSPFEENIDCHHEVCYILASLQKCLGKRIEILTPVDPRNLR